MILTQEDCPQRDDKQCSVPSFDDSSGNALATGAWVIGCCESLNLPNKSRLYHAARVTLLMLILLER